jgi:hypothetical protein
LVVVLGVFMKEKSFYSIEPKAAAILFFAQSVLLFALFVTSMLISSFYYAIVVGILLLGYISWGIFKGPSLGKPLIRIGSDNMFFNDQIYTGTRVFNIAEIQQLSLIGPASSRKVRLNTVSGADEVVCQALRGKRLMRVREFLHVDLPKQIQFVEEEPPTWADTIRGDY